MRSLPMLFCWLMLISMAAVAQNKTRLNPEDFIRTKEGEPLYLKSQFVDDCLSSMKHQGFDRKEAAEICDCMVNRMDRRYSNAKVKTNKFFTGSSFTPNMLRKDTALANEMDSCLNAVASRNIFAHKQTAENMKARMKKILMGNKKDSIDLQRLDSYCDCAVNVMKDRKIPAERLDELSDPNSLLYNEIAYRCGQTPYKKLVKNKAWHANAAVDIKGPATDTISVITVDGMTKVKLKTGSKVYVWMLDSGATDLFISEKLANKLFEEKFLTDGNYLGTDVYVMANGMELVCNVYRANNVQIGKYTLDNVIIASSPQADVFLMGKSLLNKFSKWSVDNRKEVMILEK